MANVKTAQVRQLRPVAAAVGLRIRLLGPMTVTIGGRPVTIAAKKARALLGYLALREGAEVARGVITGLLWGERSEGQARASLRQTLSELKRALGETASSSILASKEAIAWAPRSAWIDARQVEAASGSADDAALVSSGNPTGCGQTLEALEDQFDLPALAVEFENLRGAEFTFHPDGLRLNFNSELLASSR